MSKTLSLSEFETAFQTLLFRLTLKISHRFKTRLLSEFCRLLESQDNAVIHHSYYQEILPHLQQYLTRESLSYQPIDDILALYASISYIHKSESFDTDTPEVDACRRIVHYQAVATLTYIAEYQRSIQLACEMESVHVDVDRFAGIGNFEAFYGEIEHQALPTHVVAMFAEIGAEIEAFNVGSSCHQVWIPLVERFEGTPVDMPFVGTIYPLELDLEARNENRVKDIISFNNHPIGQDDLVTYQAQDAILAARNQYAFLSRRSTERYTVTFGFPLTDYAYSGSSFGFGMALLALCNLERVANLRRQALISASLAITGGIDLMGNVRGVNEKGLEEKIRTAFFSPLSGMVLPEENALAGRIILDKLQEAYPGKPFSIIPESTLPRVLDNRRILTYKDISFTVWTKNHILHPRMTLIIRLVLLVLLAVLLIMGSVSLMYDQNPSDYKVEGEHIMLFNNSGKYLWELEVGHVPAYLMGDKSKKSILRRLQIDDYDGDGEDEVLIGTVVRQHDYNGRLYFLETDGSIKWMFFQHPKLRFGAMEYSDNYGVRFIHPYKHKKALTHNIYAGFFHMPWFPNRLVRFDVEGNQLDEFIHPGGIYDMELRDLNGDADPEMLLGCTNNAFNSAALAIMPSRGFTGTAPRWENTRQLEGGRVDSTLIYIKFPAWGKYDILGGNARTFVKDVLVDSHEGFIAIVGQSGSEGLGTYLYSFDLDLNLIGLAVSDSYLREYHQAFGEDFFARYDRNKWQEEMSMLDVWRKGRWTTAGLTR